MLMFLDGGYGATENHSLNMILESLPEDERKEFEEELRKEDETAYLEFKEWQREYNQD